MELWELELREPEQLEPLPRLNTREVHDALLRLVSHGLVDGRESPTMQSTSCHSLGVTAAGLIVLGEWPDLDRVTSAAGIHCLLNALADGAPAEARCPLRRAGGTVSRTAADVITETLTALARDVGRAAADE